MLGFKKIYLKQFSSGWDTLYDVQWRRQDTSFQWIPPFFVIDRAQNKFEESSAIETPCTNPEEDRLDVMSRAHIMQLRTKRFLTEKVGMEETEKIWKKVILLLTEKASFVEKLCFLSSLLDIWRWVQIMFGFVLYTCISTIKNWVKFEATVALY